MTESDSGSLEEKRRIAGQLFREGRLPEAIELQRAIIDAQRDGEGFPVEDCRTLAFFLFTIRDHEGVVGILREADGAQPDDYRILRDLGRSLVLLRRPDEALECLDRARRLQRHDAEIHDALAHSYGLTGNLDRAAKAGEVALLLKATELSGRISGPLPSRRPPPFNKELPARNIIAFSLGEPDQDTLRSALLNVRNAMGIYPEWRCRFYLHADAPAPAVRTIVDAGAQVVQVSGKGRLRDSSLWNLHVLADENVDYFLVRDIRCALNARERAAVDDWLQSGKWFHVMRDHYAHTDLIMPGMWGGAKGGLPNVRQLLDEIDPAQAGPGSLARTLLGQCIWPRIRGSACIHDSVHRSLNAREFPEHGLLPEGQYVGQVIIAPRTLERRERTREMDPDSATPGNLIESGDDRLDLPPAGQDDEPA